jgi:hypothetical protein
MIMEATDNGPRKFFQQWRSRALSRINLLVNTIVGRYAIFKIGRTKEPLITHGPKKCQWLLGTSKVHLIKEEILAS